MMTAILIPLVMASAPLAADACRVLIPAKAAGEAIVEIETLAVPCPLKSPSAKVRYAQHDRSLHARFALAAGEPLGRVYFPAQPKPAEGDPVVLTARVGSVTISRPAIALQAGEPGRRFFARLDDGKVIVAPPLADAR